MAPREKVGFARSDEVFGSALRKARERRGMTQAELAEEMHYRGFDFQQQTIYKIEAGKRKVTVGEGIALADILAVPLEMMIEADNSSLRSLALVARGAAEQVVAGLAEDAYSLAQSRESFQVLRAHLRQYSRAVEAFGEDDQDAQPLVELLEPVLEFEGLNAFVMAWRTLLEDSRFPKVLAELHYDVEETLDEWRRVL